MKMKLLLLAMASLALIFQLPLSAQADNGPEIKLRGVVEGFYGTPWNHAQRLDMLSFMASQKLNAYIYAPKDDEFHRKFWRQPYPADKYQELAELTQKAKKLNIDIIFFFFSGNDIDFNPPGCYDDRAAMVNKLMAMYDIGIRHFALFFDDIPTLNAKGQAEFVNWVNDNFVKTRPDIAPLILVPTEYHLHQMAPNGQVTEYTKTMANSLQDDIMVLYTGSEVCPDGLKLDTVRAVNQLYGKKMGIWWNYPVSDYMKEKLALGPVDKLDKKLTNKDIFAFFINPMEKPELSKIAIATGADFALNPADYDEKAAWDQAIQDQYGQLADDMKIFANHSQRLENNWAHIGRRDAPELRSMYFGLWKLVESKNTIPKLAMLDKLTENNKTRARAISRLLKNLPTKALNEGKPQLEQLQRMTEAEKYALLILQDKTTKKQRAEWFAKFRELKEQIAVNESTAKISEESLGKFINDFDGWYGAKSEEMNSND